MVIKDVTLTRCQNKIVLSATCKIRKIGWDNVYFSLDFKKRAYSYNDASPFAAALLLASMKQGEDLIIKGSISKQLYRGIHSIMDEVLQWGIGLKPINIRPDSLVEDTHQPRRTASFFSGGVDSFYTYLKHKTDSDKNHRIDSFILVRGFDIDLRNQKLWDVTVRNIKEIAANENIELVLVESNIHKLLEPILPWGYGHGGSLAAVGLFLRNRYRQVYIPSTFSAEEQLPWGSHLALDKHWSTEKMQFIHDGAEATRVNKVLWQVATSPVALKHLRVCSENIKGAYNCGSCEKCVRTMVSLYAAGVLEKAATFPKTITANLVAQAPYPKGEGKQIFYGETQNLQALKDRNLAPFLQKALTDRLSKMVAYHNSAKGKLATKRARYLNKLIYIDHVYTRGYAFAVLSFLFGRRFS